MLMFGQDYGNKELNDSVFLNAENETYGQIQLDNILVEIGQEVVAGEVIGYLLRHRPSAHIHYMLQMNFEPVCPYKYFSPEAKGIFDALWPYIGYGTNPCNDTSLPI